jgi:hypothetical protein
MKAVRVILAIFLILAVAFLILLGVSHYLIWPKPQVLSLVPGSPLAYIAASNLDKTISAVEESEFAKQFAKSPLWSDIKSSRLGRQVHLQKLAWDIYWENYIGGDPLKLEDILQLVKRDALLAFYGETDFLLISAVDLLTLLNITWGDTEEMLVSRYGFVMEEYKGIKLLSVKIVGQEFSYGFIGRVGLLGSDKSLLKAAIDIHKDREQGLAAEPGFRELTVNMPESDLSFYMNVAKSLGAYSNIDPRLRYLLPIAEYINPCVGAVSGQDGNIRLDVRASHTSSLQRVAGGNPSGDDVFVPASSMVFASSHILGPGLPFEALRASLGVDLRVMESKLAPVLRDGVTIAFLEPEVKEFQLLPPAMLFLQVKDRSMAETTLEDIKNSLKIGGKQLEFALETYENIPINLTKLPIGMGISLDAGYTFIGDDLLVIATDVPALKASIDVSLEKQPSLTEEKHYTDVLAPILDGSDGQVFMNLVSVAAITKQAARLYAWRSKLMGDREAEQMATMLYQNAFLLESWKYMGATLDSQDGKVNLKLVLDAGY